MKKHGKSSKCVRAVFAHAFGWAHDEICKNHASDHPMHDFKAIPGFKASDFRINGRKRDAAASGVIEAEAEEVSDDDADETLQTADDAAGTTLVTTAVVKRTKKPTAPGGKKGIMKDTKKKRHKSTDD